MEQLYKHYLARVRTIIFIFIYFTIVTLPAILLLGLWFLLQFFDGVAALSNVQQGMGGVAYFAVEIMASTTGKC